MFGLPRDIFDAYGRNARLFPGLLTASPLLLAMIAWFPKLLTASIGGALLTLAMSCGLLYALSSWTRTKGKRIESRLIESWGGRPTTILLRHTSALDPMTRARYHKFLSDHIPGLSILTQEQETASPLEADATYNSAINWLRERTRGKDFPLIERENAQYGFRRNLRGLKSTGLVVCGVSFLTSSVAVVLRHANSDELLIGDGARLAIHILNSTPPEVVAAFVVNLIALLAWVTIVTDDWVREAGDQYAMALLACCDFLAASEKRLATKARPKIRAP